MQIKLERCTGKQIRATVLTGQYAGSREVFNIDLDSVSRIKAVSTIRDCFVHNYGAKRNSIKSQWWN